MPRWRIPVEILVEATTPEAARAQVTREMARLATANDAPAAVAHRHICPATRAATPPRPLTAPRRINDPRYPIRRSRPA